jgi:hypothetical protein
MKDSERITMRSVGQYDPEKWLDEGDGLLASAKVVRNHWLDYKQTFPESIQGLAGTDPDWALLEGLPRSSMLLLGYSVEMYLKAGLTKACFGCPEEMFKRDVKTRFGHDLVSLAKEISFDFKEGDKASFEHLENMVLFDARYPVFVPKGQDHTNVANQQTQKIWSKEKFNIFCMLAEKVREHARAIDNDSNNPSIRGSYSVDQDGFLVFRDGGHLPPRITYRVSSVQIKNGATSLGDMKTLFASPKKNKKSLFTSSWYTLLHHCWDSAQIYEDRKGKTIPIQNPLQ